MQKVESYLNDQQAAEFLNLSKQTLRNWRTQCRGPVYSKFGRAVRYDKMDLEEFANRNKVGN